MGTSPATAPSNQPRDRARVMSPLLSIDIWVEYRPAVRQDARWPTWTCARRDALSDHRPRALPRIVDEHGLGLGEEVEPFLRHLPPAHSGRLDAAERELHLAAHGGLVDVDHAGLD